MSNTLQRAWRACVFTSIALAAGTAQAACVADVQVTSQWNTGMVVNIGVRNTSSATTVSAWEASWVFSKPATVRSLWSAQLSTAGGRQVARPVSYNGQIPPSQRISFGYVVEHAQGAAPTVQELRASGTGCGASNPDPGPVEPTTLKGAFGKKFLVGAAIGPNHMADATETAVLTKHFSSVTAENWMKPSTIAVGEGRYNFGPADQIVDFAQRKGLKVRGHTLVWYGDDNAPAWFFAGDANDPAYKDIVAARLDRYVRDVVTHFKGKVYAWDVVNEVIDDDTRYVWRRNSRWYQVLGPRFLEVAFRAARAADPNVKLFINEYGTERADKWANLMKVVREMRAKGVPIDGVGQQVHLSLPNPDVDQIDRALGEVSAMGLQSHVTELDISFHRWGDNTDYGYKANVPASVWAEQTAVYGRLFKVFAKYDNLTSVTTWGVTDKYTWLSFFPIKRYQAPFMFDDNGQAKPAFYAVMEAAK
jgi:endo-1,4-beta-xylanase